LSQSGDLPAIPERITSDTSLASVLPLLKPRSDLTYRSLENISFHDIDLHQSLFTGSHMRSCNIRGVIFQRSDLDGVLIEQCIFQDCNFRNCDLRSNQLGYCEFIRCDFGQILLDDCQFTGCAIINCSFKNAAQTGNSFLECTFSNNDLSPGTLLHNRYEHCRFTDMILGDCTFLYNVMFNCQFHEAKINGESVGMTFGLSAEDIKKLDLVYLGEVQTRPEGVDLVDLLLEEYGHRKWLIGILTMRLNFDLTSPAYAISQYLSATGKRSRQGGIVKGEELRFLGTIFAELRKKRRLPLMSCAEAVEWVHLLEDRYAVTEQPSGPPALQNFSNRLIILIQDMLDELEQLRVPLPPNNSDLRARLTLAFRQAPSENLELLLNRIAQESGVTAIERTASIEIRFGSYIEIFSTTLLTMLGLQVFLFLINGCVIQITELKARLKILKRETLPSTYLRAALQPRQKMPEMVGAVVKGLVGYCQKLPWLAHPSLAGLNEANVEKAEFEVVGTRND
jgi:uncharacterized protein YjbI with pentapeptide repeats